MSYKDLLVLIDPSGAGGNVVECAVNLAAAQGAHLTGLYLGYDPLIGFAEAQIPTELLQMHQDNLARAEQEGRQGFEEACRRGGITGEWRAASEARLANLILSVRYVDLVVMSGNAADTTDLVAHRYADNVVMSGGRPVLLIPEGYRWHGGFSHVMVAWDGSREATRAMHDALPLLQAAHRVTVMEIADKDDVVARDPASDVARHMARHGLDIESAHAVKTEIGVGDQLLSASVDHGAELLVAGAYSHSRLREFALGGVTRHLMTHLTVPMLFSH